MYSKTDVGDMEGDSVRTWLGDVVGVELAALVGDSVGISSDDAVGDVVGNELGFLVGMFEDWGASLIEHCVPKFMVAPDPKSPPYASSDPLRSVTVKFPTPKPQQIPSPPLSAMVRV